jgi:hypothetical protein
MIGGSESKPDSEVHEFSLHGAELQRTKFPALFLLFSRWKGFCELVFSTSRRGLDHPEMSLARPAGFSYVAHGCGFILALALMGLKGLLLYE